MFEVPMRSRNCDGVSRRALLKIGGVSLFGLSLPRFLEARAKADSTARDVNCIYLFTEGGMSNIDTLDMKPLAPVEYRGEFHPIDTNLPGTQVCEHMPWMAKSMDKVCVVKSIVHAESGDHAAAQHYMLTGHPQRPDPTGQPVGATIHPSLGCVVGREGGWKNGLPPHVLFMGKGKGYYGAGYMGSKYDPLSVSADPNAAGFRVEDVSIPEQIGSTRTDRRKTMLARLDAWQRQAETKGTAVLDRNEFYRQAFELITSPAAKKAFLLDEEPAAVRDRYGRTREGQAALLSRRLIEAGVRFVTIGSGGWDTHNNNFISLRDKLLPALDKAWSALLEDLQQRGLLDNTLVLCAGEFGRTPGVNGAAGRDHYAPCNAVGMSGAGVQMGRTISQTDAKCTQVIGQRNTTLDWAATIYRILAIDGNREYHTNDGRPVSITSGGQPIAGVLA